jgi:hypothetical protein
MSLVKQWLVSRRVALQERIAFMHRLRLRALAVTVGLGLAVVAAVSLVSAPLWPMLAGAVAIACVAVSSVTSRLSHRVCLGCGRGLDGVPVGQYGAICPGCGTIATPARVSGAEPAMLAEADAAEAAPDEVEQA